jgi:ribonuclease H2 subunit C
MTAASNLHPLISILIVHIGTQHVHFRGRHLHGTSIPLPATHTGAILNVTDKQLPQHQPQPHVQEDEDDEDMQEQIPEEVRIAEQVGEFGSIVVWEHGTTIDEDRDGFARGMKEWVGWAEAMHVDDKEEDNAAKADQ